MDIKSLKDKILQLAIQGKLVPQNENDEPASVLLEKIKVKKGKNDTYKCHSIENYVFISKAAK